MPPSGGTRTPLNISVGFQQAFAPSTGLFSPGVPPVPVRPQPPRVVDFPSGVNLNYTPRSYEPFGFPELRAFGNVELVRLAIETRKDQLERLDWQIKTKDGRKKARKDADERISKVRRFFEMPDRRNPFPVWLRMALEDLLVLDAPAFEKRRTRNGELYSLDVIPGDTIKVLVDETGRRPEAPLPAYQQIIKGTIWASLSEDELLYRPRNPRAGKLYGFGPVEQVLVTINTIMRRQGSQLAYFTDGNIPAGLANVPDGWTVDQVKDWQEWMDAALSGNLAERRKLLWAPAGTKYQAFKEAPIKDEFDEWLARIVCFAFSLPPTPFIRQMNKGTASDDNERALEEGLAPLMGWVKRLVDAIIWQEFGFRDLEFAWNVERDVDPEKAARTNDVKIRNGTMTINEARDEDGRDPVEGGDTPMIYTASGATPLDRVLNPPEPEPAAIGHNGGPPIDESDADTKQKLASVIAELQRLI